MTPLSHFQVNVCTWLSTSSSVFRGDEGGSGEETGIRAIDRARLDVFSLLAAGDGERKRRRREEKGVTGLAGAATAGAFIGLAAS